VDPTNPITSFHFTSACNENQSPFWNEAHNDWDYQNPADQPAEVTSTGAPNPPLNGFVWTAAYDARSDGFMDVYGRARHGLLRRHGSELLLPLWRQHLERQTDGSLQSCLARQINRMYMLSATSYGHAYPLTSSEGRYPASRFSRSCKCRHQLENLCGSKGVYYNGQECSDTEVSDSNGLCLIQVFLHQRVQI